MCRSLSADSSVLTALYSHARVAVVTPGTSGVTSIFLHICRPFLFVFGWKKRMEMVPNPYVTHTSMRARTFHGLQCRKITSTWLSVFFFNMILPASPLVSDDSTVPALTSATYSYWVSIKTAVFMNLLLFTFLFFCICAWTAAKTAPLPPTPSRCFFSEAKRWALGLRTATRERGLNRERFRTARFAASLSHRWELLLSGDCNIWEFDWGIVGLVKAISPVKERWLVLEKPTFVYMGVWEGCIRMCEARDCFN